MAWEWNSDWGGGGGKGRTVTRMWLPSGAGLDPSTNWEDPVNQSHSAEMQTSACSYPWFISHFSLYARHFPDVQRGLNSRAACSLGVRGSEESRYGTGGQSDAASRCTLGVLCRAHFRVTRQARRWGDRSKAIQAGRIELVCDPTRSTLRSN